MNPKRLVVISGLSGAGKTVALHTLEDTGFYCVDNLPLGFLAEFAREVAGSRWPAYRQVAVGIDVRNATGDLADLPMLLQRLKSDALAVELVFIEASDDMLLKRFSETRRRHPLSGDALPLPGAIAAERARLAPLSDYADLRVDTSAMHVHRLREWVRERVARRAAGVGRHGIGGSLLPAVAQVRTVGTDFRKGRRGRCAHLKRAASVSDG